MAALIGGAFGLSGVRALTLALPPLLIAGRSFGAAVVFVLAFGAGVTAAMVGFGVAFQAARRGLLARFAGDSAAAGLWTARGIGVVAIAVGLYWVARNLTIS
jgi:hypothetical protein